MNSKSKWWNNKGTVNLMVTSANVFPRQTRLPPINGVKARGFLGIPFGARAQIFSLSFVSNLSGTNREGSLHYKGSWCIASKES